MNIKEIKEMISLMNENGLVELDLEKDGLKIRLKKHTQEPAQSATAAPEVTVPSSAIKNEERRAEEKSLIEIKSPMVGTFYRAPSPESAAFIDIGSDIQPGQVVCIIEAMKLMNEIKAEIKGRIKEILVENGHPVEFGQVLFRVEPL